MWWAFMNARSVHAPNLHQLSRFDTSLWLSREINDTPVLTSEQPANLRKFCEPITDRVEGVSRDFMERRGIIGRADAQRSRRSLATILVIIIIITMIGRIVTLARAHSLEWSNSSIPLRELCRMVRRCNEEAARSAGRRSSTFGNQLHCLLARHPPQLPGPVFDHL